MAQTEKLEHRALGRGGLSVSAIGLGCMSLSGVYGAAEDAASEALIRKRSTRASSLDSSDMYGGAITRRLIGRAIKGRRDGSCWRPSSARRRTPADKRRQRPAGIRREACERA